MSDLAVDKQHPSNLTKVLLQMRVPERYTTYTVRPMLILWMLITDDVEKLNPHFTIAHVPISDTFSEMDIFSVSLYLRQLYAEGVTVINLETPHIDARMKLLETMMIAD